MTTEPVGRAGFTPENLAQLADPTSQAIQLSLVRRLTAPDYRPPVLPIIALRLVDLSRKPSVTMREIAAVVEQDPMLAADMLKVTHSAIFGLSSPVRTVEEALVRFGIRRATDLFVQAALSTRLFRCRGYDDVLERLRRHSVATAEISRTLCQAAQVADDFAYLTGLLHDVGIAGCILALSSRGSQLVPPPFIDAWPAIRAIQRGFALHLTTRWQLPKEIRRGLSQHFAAQQSDPLEPLAAATVLAEELAARANLGFEDESSGQAAARAQALLGLSDEVVEAIVQQASSLLGKGG
jgi:HD-like signal output (HDOD) protein